MSNVKTQQYRALTDREQARTKLNVFFGSFDSAFHSFIEQLMNARDELKNNCNGGTINVTLLEDNQTLIVEDNGRGINLHNIVDGVANYVLLFETLFASGNYDNAFSEDSIETIGANGVGNACTAMTSIYFQATEYKENMAYEVTYKDGTLEREYREYKTDKEHGTKIVYRLDPSVYTSTVFGANEIENYIKIISSTTNNITYTFTYEEETKEFFYNNYEEYLEECTENKLCSYVRLPEKVYTSQAQKDGQAFTQRDRMEVLFSLSTTPFQQTFLNGGYLPEEGTFYKGIVEGFKKFFNKTIKKGKLTDNDVIMSLNIYGNMGSNNPVYSNQTKKASSNELYKKLASQYIQENLEILKNEQPKLIEQMQKHLTTINTLNTKTEDNVKNIKKKLSEKVDSINNRVEGLTDCRIHGEEAELFICEGQSALSTCVLSRNAHNQAVIAVRGKILSTLKVGYDKIFASQLIVDIIKVLGCGIEYEGKSKKKDLDTFKLDNLKYHKIIITTDQDADGASIACLLLTMFYRLTPYLVENGYIYIAKTPLYEVTYEDGSLHYAFTDKEKETLLSGHNLKKCKIQRNKGLGELEAKTMAKTTMNPETRVLDRVTVEDVKRMQLNFEKWLGTETQGRKEHIENHLHLYTKDLD